MSAETKTGQEWGVGVINRVKGEVWAYKKEKLRFQEELDRNFERLLSDIAEQNQAISHSIGVRVGEMSALIEDEPEEFQNAYREIVRAREVGATIDLPAALQSLDIKKGREESIADAVSRWYKRGPGYYFPERRVRKLLQEPGRKRKKGGKLSMHTPRARLKIKALYKNKKAREFRRKVTPEMAKMAINIEVAKPWDLDEDPFDNDKVSESSKNYT